MSEPDDLIRKADALLGRYGRPTAASAETDIPVLTEVVEPAAVLPTAASADPPRAAEVSGAEFEALIATVRDGLATSLAGQLEERLAEHLESALGTLAERMRSEVETLVRAAVEEALARLDEELRASAGRAVR